MKRQVASRDMQLLIERRGATRYNFGAIAEVTDLDESCELVSLTRDLSFSGS